MSLHSLADTVTGYFARTCGYKVEYDLPGHRQEYTVTIGEPGSTDDIPYHIAPALEEILGDTWSVWDRGTRLEIVSNEVDRPRDDRVILAALAEVCAPS